MKKKADSKDLNQIIMGFIALTLTEICTEWAEKNPLETIMALTCVLANEVMSFKGRCENPEDAVEQWVLNKLREVSKPLSDGTQLNFKDYINLSNDDSTGEAGVADPS